MTKKYSIPVGLSLAVLGAILVLAGNSTLIDGLGIAVALLGIGWIAISRRS